MASGRTSLDVEPGGGESEKKKGRSNQTDAKKAAAAVIRAEAAYVKAGGKLDG